MSQAKIPPAWRSILASIRRAFRLYSRWNPARPTTKPTLRSRPFRVRVRVCMCVCVSVAFYNISREALRVSIQPAERRKRKRRLTKILISWLVNERISEGRGTGRRVAPGSSIRIRRIK